jgi:two-component system, chemotaxis family, chemotaxis protein CheY
MYYMAKTILVVEDSSSIRQLLSSTLRQFGYTVVEAVDGRDGLVKLEDLAADLIITDLHMPTLDGIGLIHGVRANSAYRFVPIIILTTENQNSIKHEAVTAGASAWVTKPFKPAEILDVIRKVMH